MKFHFRESLQLLYALLILIFVMMASLNAGPHMTLVACLIFAGLCGKYLKGFKWETLESYMVQGVSQCLKAVFILGLIGVLIAAWMISGTIPTIFYYGIQILDPEWFLVSALLVTILVSTFTGSSLTTAGTIGVALMGISKGFGLSAPMTAGAVICGACFGDKLSPLSDTTNFASGIVEAELFDHIRHLLWTTVPALLLTLLAFTLAGHQGSVVQDAMISKALETLQQHFNISLMCLISPALVIYLAFRQLPGLPVLITGLITALATTALVQNNLQPALWFKVLTNGYSLQTNSPLVDQIINRGGLLSMMFPISLVIIALAFGGVIQGMGVIDALMGGIRGKLKGPASLVAWATGSAIGINVLTGEQYLSILLPGQAFKNVFKERGLRPEALSRCLEDGGTLVNPLIPWGVCGAFFSATLEVSVADYLPYTFFLYLSPLFTILIGFSNCGKARG